MGLQLCGSVTSTQLCHRPMKETADHMQWCGRSNKGLFTKTDAGVHCYVRLQNPLEQALNTLPSTPCVPDPHRQACPPDPGPPAARAHREMGVRPELRASRTFFLFLLGLTSRPEPTEHVSSSISLCMKEKPMQETDGLSCRDPQTPSRAFPGAARTPHCRASQARQVHVTEPTP